MTEPTGRRRRSPSLNLLLLLVKWRGKVPARPEAYNG